MPAHPMRSLRLTAIGAAAAAGLLLLVGLEYGTSPLSTKPAAPERAPAAGSATPANALTLSVFEQPRPVPEIRLQDDQGRALTLADFRGRVVLLNLWATWCVPCRQEMATLDRLQARLGGKDFLVMALSIDRKGGRSGAGFLPGGRRREARHLSRSIGKGIAEPRHSGPTDDAADRPRGPRGRPEDGCRRVGPRDDVPGRADDPAAVSPQRW